jgi:transcriptional regulator with XRE-family HTH domain
MDLGNTIKKLRLQKGLKQNTFAAQCDITPAYLSQIENNLKEPNMSTLKEIATHLGVPLPILFFLSMDNEDVQPAKRKAFEMLAPSIQSMINEFFLNSSAKHG